jgi:hypothetical protein
MAYAVDAYQGVTSPRTVARRPAATKIAAGYGQYVNTRTVARHPNEAKIAEGYRQYVATRNTSAAQVKAREIADLRWGTAATGFIDMVTGRRTAPTAVLPPDAAPAHAETLSERSFDMGRLLSLVGLGDTSGTEDAVISDQPMPVSYDTGGGGGRDLLPLLLIGGVGLALAIAFRKK